MRCVVCAEPLSGRRSVSCGDSECDRILRGMRRRLARRERPLDERAWKYGLSPGRIVDMHSEQGGSCAVCRTEIDLSDVLVDHDHSCCPGPRSCGSCVRGLLCRCCNAVLGMARDDAGRLDRAANYLRRFS